MKKSDFKKLNEKVIAINQDCALVNGTDEENARSIIKMLDYVEKDGWMIDLRIALDQGDSGVYLRIPGEYEAFICYDQKKQDILFDKNIFYPKQDHYGKTRWEAVAKAFVVIYNLIPFDPLHL